ncbi:LamG domain-containing protein [Pendulispora brunnea]|uniref:LamG domain-containing protein n=1 Tax=Pendulispora brunnea TaxID=2905690 RepID=A0ABZ2K5B0_9BACT
MRRFAGFSLASAMLATACSLSQFSAEFGRDAGADAGIDGANGADGAIGCSASIFCDDFDGAQPYVKWDDAPPPPGSAISIDPTKSVSSPNSVRLQCGNDRICHLQKTLPKIDRMRVDFDVLLVTAPPVPRTIWSHSFDQSDESIEIKHVQSGMEFSICARSSCWAQRDLGDAKDVFHHVRVDVIFGDAGHIDVFVDGTPRITNAQPVPRSNFERGVFYLGNALPDPGTSSDVRIDNFTISPF